MAGYQGESMMKMAKPSHTMRPSTMAPPMMTGAWDKGQGYGPPRPGGGKGGGGPPAVTNAFGSSTMPALTAAPQQLPPWNLIFRG